MLAAVCAASQCRGKGCDFTVSLSAWMTAHLSYGRRETLCPKTVTKGCPVDSDFLRAGLFISEENASQMVPLTLEKWPWSPKIEEKGEGGWGKNVFHCCLSACMCLCSLCSSFGLSPHWLMLLKLWHLAHLNKWIWAKDEGHWQMCRQALGLVSSTHNKQSKSVSSQSVRFSSWNFSDSHNIIKTL